MRVAFIGGGNMATSLIGGLLARGTAPSDLIVSDPDARQRASLQSRFGVQAVSDNLAAATGADVILLAVKPQEMAVVARGLTALARDQRRLFISIAAGIRLQDLGRWLGSDAVVIRSMPNRPALIGAGVTALYAAPTVGAADRTRADQILGACGPTVWVERETDMDVVTAISGSGPAYFFLLIEALESAGIAAGLSAQTARTLAVETARGAGRMAAEGNEAPEQLRQQVTSKGGTTAAALEILERERMRDILRTAVEAASRRSAELAEQFGSI